MTDICPTCGLPQELCVCETIAKESQIIKVYIVRKKFGKKYTIIEGIDEKEIDLKGLTKKLKNMFACGGTTKGGIIELQGEHVQRVRDNLMTLGFSAETIQVDSYVGKRR